MKFFTEKRWFKNMVSYSLSRPPCLMFVVFVFTTGFALLFLGLYVQHSNILNVDASQSWRNILGAATRLHFCHGRNSTGVDETLAKKMKMYENDMYETVAFPAVVHFSEAMSNRRTDNRTGLIAEIPITYLGLDHDSPLYQCLVSVVVAEPSDKSDICANGTSPDCFNSRACLSVTVPKQILSPDMRIGHGWCNSSGVEMHIASAFKTQSAVSEYCKVADGITLSIASSVYPMVYLDEVEKSTVHLRLQIGAYFLFVVVLSFVLYMALKKSNFGKSINSKGLP